MLKKNSFGASFKGAFKFGAGGNYEDLWAGGHSVSSGKWSDLPGFFIYMSEEEIKFHHKYAKKWFYEEFSLQVLSVAILWNNEVGGTCKTDILIALKSRSYTFYLDYVKLSFGIFFILSCLMES